MKISEIITDKYKLRIPPTVYYDLLADVREVEEEQKPTTKNDLVVDAISRQAVLDLIADYDLSMGQVVRGIHALPSVAPQEPKTGHWVEENINGWGRKVFCSECGCTPPFEYVSNGDVYSASGYGVINKTKYCQNCGAKMIEPQESEDKE